MTKDREFLQFIHDRLRYVHHENPNIDYMHHLRSIIQDTPSDKESPSIGVDYEWDEKRY